VKINLKKRNKKKNIEKKLKSSFGIKRYKIQEVIKPGQVILIQVIKEERGQKGAALNYFYIFSRKIYGFNA
jgi:ribonuclease E